MIPRNRVRSLAHRLVEAKSEGGRRGESKAPLGVQAGGDREGPEPGCPYRIPRDRKGSRPPLAEERGEDHPLELQGLWKPVGLSSEAQWPLQEKSGGRGREYRDPGAPGGVQGMREEHRHRRGFAEASQPLLDRARPKGNGALHERGLPSEGGRDIGPSLGQGRL